MTVIASLRVIRVMEPVIGSVDKIHRSEVLDVCVFETVAQVRKTAGTWLRGYNKE
jgi:hypothetical protein